MWRSAVENYIVGLADNSSTDIVNGMNYLLHKVFCMKTH